QGFQQALGGVRLVVVLVVGGEDVRRGLQQQIHLESDDHHVACLVTEDTTYILDVLARNTASVVQLGQRFGLRSTEPGSHTRGKDDDLLVHVHLLYGGVCNRPVVSR